MINDPNYVPYTKSVGEPKRGDSAYGTNDYAKSTPLDTKTSAGIIGTPHIGGDYVPVPMKTASVTGPIGLVETTASNENLSKKYKYPQVHQDLTPLEKNQFEDHS
jgi:hypothetical protein